MRGNKVCVEHSVGGRGGGRTCSATTFMVNPTCTAGGIAAKSELGLRDFHHTHPGALLAVMILSLPLG